MKVVKVLYLVDEWHNRVELPKHIRVVVKALYAEGMKVDAIKYARQHLGLGLKEAKDLCDELALVA